MKNLHRTFMFLSLLVMTWSAIAEPQVVPVAFAKDSSSVTLSGSLKDDQVIDYVLAIKAGQTMRVSMMPSDEAVYFNVLPPGEGKAIFIGSVAGYEWAGELPTAGDYRVRTYLVNGAAKGNESSSYSLTITITSALTAATEAREFDATGEVPCARYLGQPMASCKFGVKRGTDGDAAVTITFADGFVRLIFFEGGQVSGADMIQVEGDPSYSSSKVADLFSVRVGEERYEIPEAVVFGG